MTHNIGEVARLYGSQVSLKETHCVKFRYKIVNEKDLASHFDSNKNKRDSGFTSVASSSSNSQNTNKWTDQMSSVQLSVFVVEDIDWPYQNPVWSSSLPSSSNDPFQTVELSLVPDKYHLVFEARVLSENSPYKVYVDDIRVEKRRCNRAPHFLRLASLEMNRGQSGAFSCKLIDHQLEKYLPSSLITSYNSNTDQDFKNKIALRLEKGGGGKIVRPDGMPMTLDFETLETRFSFREATNNIAGKYRCVVKEPNVSAISNYATLKIKVPPCPLYAPIVIVAGSTHLDINLNTEKFRGDGPIISTNLQYQPVGGHWSDTHPIILTEYQQGQMRRRSNLYNSGSITAGIDSHNKTTYKLWNLLPDTEYEFRVILARPYSGGQGPPGPTLRTKTKCGIPAEAITNIQAQSLNSNEISLVWDKPLRSTTRCSSYSYEIKYRPRSPIVTASDLIEVQPFSSVLIENQDQLGVTLKNLTPYIEYEIYVYIVNSSGKIQSKPVYVKTDESTPDIIKASSFKAKRHPSGEKLTVYWEKPSKSNGELKKYQIAYEATESWIENAKTFLYQTETIEVSSYKESAEITNLYPGTLYKISIRAATKKGFGPDTSITYRTAIGPPRMPIYDENKNIPITKVETQGRVYLNLIAAKSNGAPIDKYQVLVEKTDLNPNSSRNKRAIIENTGEVDTCPHLNKVRYGEHSKSNYWIAGEITHYEFVANHHSLPFVLGDNSTKYNYYNPHLKLGNYDIWFYSITKKMTKSIEGKPVENCLKLASLEITDPITLLPKIVKMYRASKLTNQPKWPNKPVNRPHVTLPEDGHHKNLSISTILIMSLLFALFLVTLGVMYAVFVQRKKSQTRLEENLQHENTTQNLLNNKNLQNMNNQSYINGVINSPNHIDSDSLKYQRINNEKKIPNLLSATPCQIPHKLDSNYHINTTINSNNSNETFDVKMYPDGRIENHKHDIHNKDNLPNNNNTQTLTINHNMSRSQESSPFLNSEGMNNSPPGYDDSGYPASLSRKGPIGSGVDNLQNSLTRTPTPNSQKPRDTRDSSILNTKLHTPNTHLSNTQTHSQNPNQLSNTNTSGIVTHTNQNSTLNGFCTPPIFLSGTLQSNTSSFVQKLTNNNTSIRVEDFPIAVNQMKSSTVSGFSADFNSIKNFDSKSGQQLQMQNQVSGSNLNVNLFTTDTANRLENKSKNREYSIVPFDHSRVRLKGTATGVLTNDYINASYVEGFKVPNYYIATQAPLDNTVIDFWDMIWHENCRVIVIGEVELIFWKVTEIKPQPFTFLRKKGKTQKLHQ